MTTEPQHGTYAQTATGGMRHIARTRKTQAVIVRKRDERTLCGRQVYAWSMPTDRALPLCSRCVRAQTDYLAQLEQARYSIARGTPSLGGWVIWDDVEMNYLLDTTDRPQRFATRAEAVAKVAALRGITLPAAKVCGAMITISWTRSVPCGAPMDERGECVVSTLHARRTARQARS